ncbi:MAG: ABC transporter substrate-binding protein [Fusobacteriaceae bacterium]
MKKVITSVLLIALSINLFSSSTVPKRAVSASQFTTEILLSIGAENQMIGTAWLDNPILPELKEKYDKIPVLSPKGISKEVFYSLNPDFLTGWNTIINPKNLGPLEELKSNGVEVYLMKSLKSNRIDDVYEDILKFGEIFNLENNSKILVDNMKNELKEIEATLPQKKIKVFAYDSGESAPFTIGGTGLGNTLISLAGGDNIFHEAIGSFTDGSWEKVLGENPEVIIIVDYGTTTAETKMKYLKEKSPIKELPAVKNNKFIVIGLEDLSTGVRIIKGIKKLSTGLHGDRL